MQGDGVDHLLTVKARRAGVNPRAVAKSCGPRPHRPASAARCSANMNDGSSIVNASLANVWANLALSLAIAASGVMMAASALKAMPIGG